MRVADHRNNFNPRARTGHDSPRPRRTPACTYFNPRARTGHDMFQSLLIPGFQFQSTCPHGARPPERIAFPGAEISIHVPARGTTMLKSMQKAGLVISIHVPARGTTLLLWRTILQISDFNPRARTGHDPGPLRRGAAAWDFNPRARTGHDPTRSLTRLKSVISIHVPARGTTS